jgi:DNA polymerase-3 subunit epsilon
MNKFIFSDTETTGLSPKTERMLEFACMEVHDRAKTGRVFHQYVNPQKEVHHAAFRVHGISWESVKDKPLFVDFADHLIEMFSGSVFVAHNAPFDVGFFNMEFKRAGRSFQIGRDCEVLDTLKLAKEIFPGQKNSLDALCSRLSIDRSNRVLHGALLDTELLVQVYIAMTQKQQDFSLSKSVSQGDEAKLAYCAADLLPSELKSHEDYIKEMIS